MTYLPIYLPIYLCAIGALWWCWHRCDLCAGYSVPARRIGPRDWSGCSDGMGCDGCEGGEGGLSGSKP